jgi:hypothetical protein
MWHTVSAHFDLLRFLLGFDTKGDSEFFGSFEDSKENPADGGGDGFDASAFQATAWADGNGEEGASSLEKDFESNPTSSHDTDDADPNSSMRKKDVQDPQRKTSRRKAGVSSSAGGGSSRPRTTSRTVEAGMEAMRVSDGENTTPDGENKERRSRTQKSEDDSRQRKRSTSRSKRKHRGQRDGRPEVAEEIVAVESDTTDAERKVGVAKMAAGIRSAFIRKQAPSDP